MENMKWKSIIVSIGLCVYFVDSLAGRFHQVEEKRDSFLKSNKVRCSNLIQVKRNRKLLKSAYNIVNSYRNRSFDHLEYHLRRINELESAVMLNIDKIKSNVGKSGSDKLSKYVNRELYRVKSDLNKLSQALNHTILELNSVQQDNEVQQFKLKDALRRREEAEHEHEVEEQGFKAVDYETGHLKNMSGLSVHQLMKLKAMERRSDPAVLHYDFKLLAEIGVLFSVSAVGGIVATFFGLPPNIGYLIGGALVGPSGFGIVNQYKEVETLSLFGSIFLLFAHGAGYNFHRSWRNQQRYYFGGALYIMLNIMLSFFASIRCGWVSASSEGLIFGAAICLSCTTPMYSYIRANSLENTPFGMSILGIVSCQDILMSFVFATPELFMAKSLRTFSFAVFKTILSYTSIVLLAVCLHSFVVPQLIGFLISMQHVHHSPLVLLGVVSVCLCMALITESLSLSLESGAFFAGLAFVGVHNIDAAITSIHVLDSLFGSLFFSCIGMLLNPAFLFRNAVEIGSIFIGISIIKILIGTLILEMQGSSYKKAIRAAICLSHVGEFALIFMIKAQALELISRRLYLLFVAVTALFIGSSPFIQRTILSSNQILMGSGQNNI